MQHRVAGYQDTTISCRPDFWTVEMLSLIHLNMPSSGRSEHHSIWVSKTTDETTWAVGYYGCDMQFSDIFHHGCDKYSFFNGIIHLCQKLQVVSRLKMTWIWLNYLFFTFVKHCVCVAFSYKTDSKWHNVAVFNERRLAFLKRLGASCYTFSDTDHSSSRVYFIGDKECSLQRKILRDQQWGWRKFDNSSSSTSA